MFRRSIGVNIGNSAALTTPMHDRLTAPRSHRILLYNLCSGTWVMPCKSKAPNLRNGLAIPADLPNICNRADDAKFAL